MINSHQYTSNRTITKHYCLGSHHIVRFFTSSISNNSFDKARTFFFWGGGGERTLISRGIHEWGWVGCALSVRYVTVMLWQEKHNSPSEERGPSRDRGLRKNVLQYKAWIVPLLWDNGVFKRLTVSEFQLTPLRHSEVLCLTADSVSEEKRPVLWTLLQWRRQLDFEDAIRLPAW